jgi:hypothetical protein
MSNAIVERVLYWTTAVLNPVDFEEYFGITHDWRELYKDKDKLAEIILFRLKEHSKSLLRKTSKQQVFKEPVFSYWLDDFARGLLEELEAYKPASLNPKTFFSRTRLARVNTKAYDDYAFSHATRRCYYHNSVGPSKLTKEEVREVIYTFLHVAKYVRDNLFVFKIDTERLDKLGLPQTTEELSKLLELPVEEISTLFRWKDTDQGYGWWASRYLDGSDEEFVDSVASFFKELDPNLVYNKKKVDKDPWKSSFIKTGIRADPYRGADAVLLAAVDDIF